MNYLLYGTESFLMEIEKNKIIERFNLAPINRNTYDFEQDSLKDMIDDAQTLSLFEDRKIIIVDNATLFTSSTKKTSVIQDPTLLETYLNHKNPNTIFIFLVREPKLDERKKIVKKMKQSEMVIACNEQKNIEALVTDLFLPNPIKREVASFFINRIGNHLGILKQEIDKIKTYLDEGAEITKEVILLLTSKTIDTDIFRLIEYIVAKDKENALEIYQELLRQNEEPIKLIVLLANQFRLIYQARELSQKGYTEGDIASTLAVHPYRVKLALQKGRGLTSTSLLDYLEKLSQLDIGIKTGLLDKESSLELFILNS